MMNEQNAQAVAQPHYGTPTPPFRRPAPFKFGRSECVGSPRCSNISFVEDAYMSAGRDPNTETCTFCDRKSASVVCRSCGYVFTGRVRGRCAHHPGILHLMDSTVCPACRSASICERVPMTSQPGPSSTSPGTGSGRSPLASISTNKQIK